MKFLNLKFISLPLLLPYILANEVSTDCSSKIPKIKLSIDKIHRSLQGVLGNTKSIIEAYSEFENLNSECRNALECAVELKNHSRQIKETCHFIRKKSEKFKECQLMAEVPDEIESCLLNFQNIPIGSQILTKSEKLDKCLQTTKSVENVLEEIHKFNSIGDIFSKEIQRLEANYAVCFRLSECSQILRNSNFENCEKIKIELDRTIECVETNHADRDIYQCLKLGEIGEKMEL